MPMVGDDDVLVQVHAAGVDQGVWHLMAGLPYPVRATCGLRSPRLASAAWISRDASRRSASA
jgi:hypothetical protein